MSKVVLDTSVLLAAIRAEIKTETLLPLFEGASVSAVNWCELHTKLHDFGMPRSPRTLSFLSILGEIEIFTETQATLAADLRKVTRTAGLSLGDRACIALAMELDADVYTADRAWAKVKLPCRVHLIR